MTMLSRIRRFAFLVALLAVFVPNTLYGDDAECPNVGPCDSCETAAGECLNPPGVSCGQWQECFFVRTCQNNGQYYWRICECEPCEGNE
jgi:hypothetical protein